MRTLAIRELTAPALRQAAEVNEIIGITNDRVLAGVLIPIGREWVEQLVDQNLSRLVHNIRRGEQEVDEVLRSSDRSDPADASAAPPPRFTTLDDLASEPSATHGGKLDRIRRVHLRDMSGRVLQAAAEKNEAIVLTSDKVVAGVIYPVTQQWVTELVEQNLSRVLYNITIGEKELHADPERTTLDDLVAEPPRTRPPHRSTT